MTQKAYFFISAVIFGLVSVGHIIRVMNNWAFVVGEMVVPIWMSWIALFLSAALCVWAISLATK